MGAYPTINLNDSIPAAPANGVNVEWQSSTSVHSPTIVNASAAVVGDGNTAHFLRGDGVFAAPSGASNNLTSYRRTGMILVHGTEAVDVIGETTNNVAGGFGSAQAVPASNQALSYQYKTTVLNTFAGLAGSSSAGSANWWNETNLNMWASCYLGATTNVRMWVGLFDIALSPATISGSDTLAANQYAAFRYSTAASDTTIKCVTCDGSTQHVINSGVSMDTQTHKYLIVINDGGSPSVQFYIDGVLVATSTSNLPNTSVVEMYYLCGCADEGATANIYISGIVVQGDY